MVKDELINRAREAHKQGELATAEELYRQVISVNPDDPDANHLLGVIHFQREEYDTALELIRKAVAVRPEHAATYNNLGSVEKALGRYDDALESFTNAIKLQPDFAEAHNNLGIVYKALGQLDNAEESYNDAIRYQPDYVKALNNLGNLFQEKGDYLISLVWYGKALELNPDLPLTHYNLGCALLEFGRLDEAEAALLKVLDSEPGMYRALLALGVVYQTRFQFGRAQQVLQIAQELIPKDLDVFIGLGNFYIAMNRHDKAEAVLQEAVTIHPESYEVYNALGLVYKHLGNLEMAQESIDRARELTPENPLVLTNKASLLIAQGLFVDSIKTCKEALALKMDCAPAYYQLAQILQGTEATETANEIRQLLQQEGRTQAQKIHLGFGLARLEEELGEYEKAFATLMSANKLKRQTFDFSIKQQQKNVERIVDVFREEKIERYSNHGVDSSVPIFIVGMPRSGTTLVEQILASHPDVYGAGELRLLNDTVANYLNLDTAEDFITPETLFSLEAMEKVGAKYVQELHSKAPDAKKVTDKMPGNYLYIGLIHLLMPQAKIIHMIRDPKDTCLSIYKKLFTYGHQYAYDFEELGKYYNLYLRIMKHWRKVLPGRFLDFRYENLVHNQEAETRRLLDYCNLEWHENCLRYFESGRTVLTASAVQVRQPINTKTVGLWERYKEGLQPLLSVLESP